MLIGSTLDFGMVAMKAKKQCPVCGKQVSQFHKTSHIIPNFAFKYCCDQDGYAILLLPNKKTKKYQTGLYAPIVCQKCEVRFSQDDNFAARFLRDKKIGCVEFVEGAEYSYEKWSAIDFLKLQKFVLSILIRSYLADRYWASSPNAQDYIFRPQISESEYQNILSCYLGTYIDDETYPILMIKLEGNFSKTLCYPIRGDNLIEFMCLEYQFFVALNGIPRGLEGFKLNATGASNVMIEPFEETSVYSWLRN